MQWHQLSEEQKARFHFAIKSAVPPMLEGSGQRTKFSVAYSDARKAVPRTEQQSAWAREDNFLNRLWDDLGMAQLMNKRQNQAKDIRDIVMKTATPVTKELTSKRVIKNPRCKIVFNPATRSEQNISMADVQFVKQQPAFDEELGAFSLLLLAASECASSQEPMRALVTLTKISELGFFKDSQVAVVNPIASVKSIDYLQAVSERSTIKGINV